MSFQCFFGACLKLGGLLPRSTCGYCEPSSERVLCPPHFFMCIHTNLLNIFVKLYLFKFRIFCCFLSCMSQGPPLHHLTELSVLTSIQLVIAYKCRLRVDNRVAAGFLKRSIRVLCHKPPLTTWVTPAETLTAQTTLTGRICSSASTCSFAGAGPAGFTPPVSVEKQLQPGLHRQGSFHHLPVWTHPQTRDDQGD